MPLEFIDVAPPVDAGNGAVWMGPFTDETARETGRIGATFFMHSVTLQKLCLRDEAAGDPPAGSEGGDNAAQRSKWVKQGGMAKIGPRGKPGTILLDPDRDGDTKLRYDDGSSSNFVPASRLYPLSSEDRDDIEKQAAKMAALEAAEQEKQQQAQECEEQAARALQDAAEQQAAGESVEQEPRGEISRVQQKLGKVPSPVETEDLWQRFSQQPGLAVRVVEAHGLLKPGRGLFSKSRSHANPYVVLRYSEVDDCIRADSSVGVSGQSQMTNVQEFKTKIVKNNSDSPVWEDFFLFENINEQSTVSVEVWNHDMLQRDIPLGQVRLRVAQVLQQQRGIDYCEGLREQCHGSISRKNCLDIAFHLQPMTRCPDSPGKIRLVARANIQQEQEMTGSDNVSSSKSMKTIDTSNTAKIFLSKADLKAAMQQEINEKLKAIHNNGLETQTTALHTMVNDAHASIVDADKVVAEAQANADRGAQDVVTALEETVKAQAEAESALAVNDKEEQQALRARRKANLECSDTAQAREQSENAQNALRAEEKIAALQDTSDMLDQAAQEQMNAVTQAVLQAEKSPTAAQRKSQHAAGAAVEDSRKALTVKSKIRDKTETTRDNLASASFVSGSGGHMTAGYWQYRRTLAGRTKALEKRRYLAEHYCSAVLEPSRARARARLGRGKLNARYRKKRQHLEKTYPTLATASAEIPPWGARDPPKAISPSVPVLSGSLEKYRAFQTDDLTGKQKPGGWKSRYVVLHQGGDRGDNIAAKLGAAGPALSYRKARGSSRVLGVFELYQDASARHNFVERFARISWGQLPLSCGRHWFVLSCGSQSKELLLKESCCKLCSGIIKSALVEQLHLCLGSWFGLQHEHLKTIAGWNIDPDKRIFLRFKSTESCHFKETRESLEFGRTSQGVIKLIENPDSDLKPVTEHLWNFGLQYELEILLYSMSDDMETHKIVLVDRYCRGVIVTGGQVEEPNAPKPKQLTYTPVDFDLTWLLKSTMQQKPEEQIFPDVDRWCLPVTLQDGQTKLLQNETVQAAIDNHDRFSTWCSTVQRYLRAALLAWVPMQLPSATDVAALRDIFKIVKTGDPRPAILVSTDASMKQTVNAIVQSSEITPAYLAVKNSDMSMFLRHEADKLRKLQQRLRKVEDLSEHSAHLILFGITEASFLVGCEYGLLVANHTLSGLHCITDIMHHPDSVPSPSSWQPMIVGIVAAQSVYNPHRQVDRRTAAIALEQCDGKVDDAATMLLMPNYAEDSQAAQRLLSRAIVESVHLSGESDSGNPPMTVFASRDKETAWSWYSAIQNCVVRSRGSETATQDEDHVIATDADLNPLHTTAPKSYYPAVIFKKEGHAAFYKPPPASIFAVRGELRETVELAKRWALWRSGLLRQELDSLQNHGYTNAAMKWRLSKGTPLADRRKQVMRTFLTDNFSNGRSIGDLLMASK